MRTKNNITEIMPNNKLPQCSLTIGFGHYYGKYLLGRPVFYISISSVCIIQYGPQWGCQITILIYSKIQRIWMIFNIFMKGTTGCVSLVISILSILCLFLIKPIVSDLIRLLLLLLFSHSRSRSRSRRSRYRRLPVASPCPCSWATSTRCPCSRNTGVRSRRICFPRSPSSPWSSSHARAQICSCGHCRAGISTSAETHAAMLRVIFNTHSYKHGRVWFQHLLTDKTESH